MAPPCEVGVIDSAPYFETIIDEGGGASRFLGDGEEQIVDGLSGSETSLVRIGTSQVEVDLEAPITEKSTGDCTER